MDALYVFGCAVGGALIAFNLLVLCLMYVPRPSAIGTVLYFVACTALGFFGAGYATNDAVNGLGGGGIGLGVAMCCYTVAALWMEKRAKASVLARERGSDD